MAHTARGSGAVENATGHAGAVGLTKSRSRIRLFGRHARYRLSDVIAWEARQFGNTQAEALPAVDFNEPATA
jgi:hypothetical protein